MSKATFKCSDCGLVEEGEALSRNFVKQCSNCFKEMIVYTFDGEPSNRGYFPEGENDERSRHFQW